MSCWCAHCHNPKSYKEENCEIKYEDENKNLLGRPCCFPVPGVVGIWVLIAVAFSNPEGSLVAQLLGIVVIFGWVFGTSFVTWLIIKAITGIRVSEEEELQGCDISECGLDAYPEFTKD